MSIGQNIKARRKALGLNQEQLAKALGYKSKSTIAKIEKGTVDVSHSKLFSFANTLNTSVDYLLNGYSGQTENKNIVITLSDQSNTPLSNADAEQNQKSKTVAVVMAGGLSTRNHQNTPNQFVNVNGKPVIIYTLEAFQHHPAIDEIYVVCLSGWESILSAYIRTYSIDKFVSLIPAGKTGALSVCAAVEWLFSHLSYHDIVLLHEATRPNLTDELISNAVRCAKEHYSAVTYEPMDEYVQFIQNGEHGVEAVDRTKILSIQSPEAYNFGKLHRTISQAKQLQHPFNETCCALVMYNLGQKLVFCEGNRYNIKIVRQEDLHFFSALLDTKTSV